MPTPAREALDWVLSLSSPPDETELRARFSAGFIDSVTVERLAPLLPTLAEGVRGEQASLEVAEVDAHRLVATVGGTEILVSVDVAPPHAMNGLLFRPVQVRVSDERLTDRPTSATGALGLGELARSQAEEAGLVGLSMHVDDRGAGSAALVGWSDLEARRAVDGGTCFPAYSITKLVTTVAVLRLVASGEIELEAPVASMLTSLTLPKDITVRHLLTHHGAVRSDFAHWAEEVPDLVELLGREVAVDGPPGRSYTYSNGGFAVLGQLIADVTGRAYEAVVHETVLDPLGMATSSFPRRVPEAGVVLHEVDDGGQIVVPPQQICTVPAAGGLWSTAAELATFARDWSTLLPDDLAAAALAPQAPRSERASIGFGFALGSWDGRRVAGHTGGGIGASSSLVLMPDDGLSAVTLVNRRHPVEPLSFKAMQLALPAHS